MKMRLSSVYVLQILAVSVSAQLLSLPKLFAPDTQAVIMDPDQTPRQSTLTNEELLISDAMARDRSINTFSGYTRDVPAISNRLASPSANSTVLAPVNSFFDGHEKAWENPDDYKAFGTAAYDGDEGLGRARRNLQRLVEAHIIPVNPWPEGKEARSLLDGDEAIRWERKDGGMVIQPGNIKVQRIASKVGNGEVWIIETARKYL
ncbi:hypothetical protein F4861DRAFT_438933 [Xylaria intraflava]|nr:hypothetical protein F4861DRAFT_438933 [Xylaria intraflava]